MFNLPALAALSALWFPHTSPVGDHGVQEPFGPSISSYSQYYDIQAHRGGRGNAVENTLPSFAWGLIEGATTLELDNGVTKDGAVVVWHDENIQGSKCQDTVPAFPHDPDFPYVGKYIANLTLAQLKTLDCGSKRQNDYPLQLLYPGVRISTLQELFKFADCVDPNNQVLWNIESKINPVHTNQTRGVQDFVRSQHAVFADSPYRDSITYQSFDWRTLIAMKALNPSMLTSALIDDDTARGDGTRTAWLAGLQLDTYPGPSVGAQIAQAAHSISADILSPAATAGRSPAKDPTMEGYIPFTTKEMVDEAHRLGLKVKPWTVNRLNVLDRITDLSVDGVITDYPDVARRWAEQRHYIVAPRFSKRHVLACLQEHMALQLTVQT